MALFRKFAKRVLIGTCTATGKFIGYVISTIKMYALLTKHEVKKQDIGHTHKHNNFHILFLLFGLDVVTSPKGSVCFLFFVKDITRAVPPCLWQFLLSPMVHFSYCNLPLNINTTTE